MSLPFVGTTASEINTLHLLGSLHPSSSAAHGEPFPLVLSSDKSPRERARRAARQCRACIFNYLFFLTAFSITAHQRCDYCDSIRRGSTAGGNILRLITARLSLIYCQKPPRSPSCEVESSPGKWRGIKREGGRLRWMADWLAGWMAAFEGLLSSRW